MPIIKDLEKAPDADNGTDTTNSTVYQSDIGIGDPMTKVEGAIGVPDADHDEVEQMDVGHMDDLALQGVCSLFYYLKTPDLIYIDLFIYKRLSGQITRG
jgi:hypothetical protein